MKNWMEAARKRLLFSPQGSAEIAETDGITVMAVSADPRRQLLRVIPGRSVGPEKERGGQDKARNQEVPLRKRSYGRKGVRLYEELSEESRKRFHFCETHLRMKGGICPHLGGRQIENCLLWQIVTSEPNLEKVAEALIIKGVIVEDALDYLRQKNFPGDLFQRDRRWILEITSEVLRIKRRKETTE